MLSPVLLHFTELKKIWFRCDLNVPEVHCGLSRLKDTNIIVSTTYLCSQSAHTHTHTHTHTHRKKHSNKHSSKHRDIYIQLFIILKPLNPFPRTVSTDCVLTPAHHTCIYYTQTHTHTPCTPHSPRHFVTQTLSRTRPDSHT